MITIFSSVVSHKTLLLIKIIVRISLAHSVPRAPTDHFRIIWCIRESIRPQTDHPRWRRTHLRRVSKEPVTTLINAPTDHTSGSANWLSEIPIGATTKIPGRIIHGWWYDIKGCGRLTTISWQTVGYGKMSARSVVQGQVKARSVTVEGEMLALLEVCTRKLVDSGSFLKEERITQGRRWFLSKCLHSCVQLYDLYTRCKLTFRKKFHG